MPQALIDAAGGRNILDDVDASWTRVNWETVERNPQVIVIVDYSETTCCAEAAVPAQQPGACKRWTRSRTSAYRDPVRAGHAGDRQ